MTQLNHMLRAFVPAAVMTMAACSEGTRETSPPTSGDRLDWTRAAALTAAANCDEAGAAFKAAAITQMELELDRNARCFLGDGGCYRWAEDAAGGGPQNAPPAPTKDDATPDDYSETNTQEQGVDEADFVKTDGTSIVALIGQDLVKLASWPAADTHETGRAKVRGYPQQFFLTGGKAVVLASASYYDFLSAEEKSAYERGEGVYDARWWSGLTLVATYDVSGDKPTLISERLFDGWTMANRRIGDKVYLAQNTWVYINDLRYWPEDLGTDPSDAQVIAAFDAMKAANRAVIEALPLDYWMPRELVVGADGTIDEAHSNALVSCHDVFVPSVHSGQSLLTVVTYDIDDDELSGSTIQGSWGNVYASTDALYVATTNWDFYWWWEPVGTEAPPLTTHVHKFVFGDDGKARYAASGSVLGYALNQFSFDEHEGVLRVATTDGFGWWNNGQAQTESRVTTLSQEGKKLVEKGVVGGLGKGEQIYAVRFEGDKGYVVTFRQVDPLYVLDLADAKHPKVAGELKVPGFSSYIHPIDATHLLTIGRDANDQGQVQGLKLEVFDVSDPAAPKSTATAVIGDGWNTWSEAQWDHHAFVYYPSRGLLAIPVSGWLEDAGYWTYKSELFVFDVTTTSVTQRGGSISHTPFLAELGVNLGCRYWSGWYEAWIRRGIFIEDYVYSISNLGVMVHDTRDLAKGPVADLLLADDTSWYGGGLYADPCYADGGEK